MPLGPDPEPARAVLARLDAVRAAVASGEEDVLASLVVTGEPRPQRVLDDWLDQVADTLRALGEAADRLAPPLARSAGSPASRSGNPAPSLTPDAASRPAPGIRPSEQSEAAP